MHHQNNAAIDPDTVLLGLAPIAKLDLARGRTVLVTYASDRDGTKTFGLALEGVHTADYALGAITIDATGHATTLMNADAARMGFDAAHPSITPLQETAYQLAELIDAAMVARDYGLRLTGAGYSLLRALMAGTQSKPKPTVLVLPLEVA